MELNSLLILLEAAEYLERRDRGISKLNWQVDSISKLTFCSWKELLRVAASLIFSLCVYVCVKF